MDDARITALALAARDGGSSAVEEFVRATRPHVWRFTAHLTDVQSADDLTQETFVRALRSLAAFAGRAPARSWLLSIARRTVADRYRSAAARPRAAACPDWQTAAEAGLAGGRARFEEEFALTDLLARLPETRRTAFVLTRLQGFSYAEVAELTGVPVGTVRSRVARAREDLIHALRPAEAPQPVASG
ncbi:sigma-70 family RNA polymerase sigma factor [Actinorugispora endophytica]|uniref:RNA polymerase sigma factor n=1 Tax=Actinorugispora endophytica TaxID=1605990 RepID=A0A4R6V5G0_9ACTN|nr:sigma-70 family RNA polymerase sigma factor [Actinorugispora endophytica]TDQ55564.1 RNA polymerase sigma-70 factor (ECF subfamily) [Actinorugispora endophytica]